MTTLKVNVLANFISQIYVALIGVAMVPVLLRYMGAEAYGLVGFFAMLQGWFVVLDLGFSAALSREAARRKGLPAEMADLRRLLRAVEKLFLLLTLVCALIALVAAPYVAQQWLRVEHLASADVCTAFVLMTWAALLRWVSGLYRGVITGLDRQVWLGGFSCLIATVRFVAVISEMKSVAGRSTSVAQGMPPPQYSSTSDLGVPPLSTRKRLSSPSETSGKW